MARKWCLSTGTVWISIGFAYRAADVSGVVKIPANARDCKYDPQRLAAPSRVKKREKLQYLVRGINRQVEEEALTGKPPAGVHSLRVFNGQALIAD